MSNKSKIKLLKLIVALIFSILSTVITVMVLIPANSATIGAVMMAFASLFALSDGGYANV